MGFLVLLCEIQAKITEYDSFSFNKPYDEVLGAAQFFRLLITLSNVGIIGIDII